MVTLPEGVIVRPAQISDAPMLRDHCFPELPLADVYNRLETVTAGRRKGRMWGLTAQHRAVVIGYGQLTAWGRGVEISDLIVEESWRGQGIGTGIIVALMEQASQLGFRVVEIGVEEANSRAHQLYTRLGFRQDRVIDLRMAGGFGPVIYLSRVLTPPEDS